MLATVSTADLSMCAAPPAVAASSPTPARSLQGWRIQIPPRASSWRLPAVRGGLAGVVGVEVIGMASTVLTAAGPVTFEVSSANCAKAPA